VHLPEEHLVVVGERIGIRNRGQWAARCSLRKRPSLLSPPGWPSGTVSS
jgi:hypothetical protein